MKLIYIALIYLSGFVTALNAAAMVYGFPKHFDPSWGQIGVCAILTLFSAMRLGELP